jgi:hypothetical protein
MPMDVWSMAINVLAVSFGLRSDAITRERSRP